MKKAGVTSSLPKLNIVEAMSQNLGILVFFRKVTRLIYLCVCVLVVNSASWFLLQLPRQSQLSFDF